MTDVPGIFASLEGHCTLAEGLSDAEVESIEETYRFRFLPDLRSFLQFKLPVGEGFPDWRNETIDEIQRRLSDPIEGVLVEIGNGFWFDGWGERPAEMIAAFQQAVGHINEVPLLIPLHRSCYLPAAPFLAGNPVFAVDGVDVVVRSDSLAAYFENAFTSESRPSKSVDGDMGMRHIEFWSELAARRT